MLRQIYEHMYDLRALYLLFLPGVIIAGNLATPLAAMFVFGFAVAMHFKGLHLVNIFAFLFMLHMGEIRHHEWPIFYFSANVKVFYSVALGLLVLYDIFREKYHFNVTFLFLLPFVFVALFSLLNSPIASTAALKTFSFTLTYFTALHYTFYYFQKYKYSMQHLYMYFILLLGFGFLLIFIVPDQAFFGNGVRYRGAFGNPNGLGLFGMICAIFFIYFFEKHKRSRLEIAIAFGLALFSIILSGNKGNLFALMIFAGVFILFNKKTRIWGIFMILGGILLLPILDFETMNAIVQLFGLQEQFRLQSIYTGSGRYVAWEWALQWVVQEPLIGRGFSFEELLFDKYLPIYLTMTGHQGGVHNSYLVFLLNTGVLGLIFVSVFFVKFFTAIRDKRFATAIGISFAVSIFFEGYGSASLNYFSVVFIFLCIAMMIDPSKAEE